MPKGFILLTHTGGDRTPRVAVGAIEWYMRGAGRTSTSVSLSTRTNGESLLWHVDETEEEIDALIEQAQITSDLKVWGSPQPSEFAAAMGEAVQAFGGGR